MMANSLELKKGAREMLAWLKTPAWSGMASSWEKRERETLQTSAILYRLASDAQSIGKMLQAGLHVDGATFESVLDELVLRTNATDLSPEEQDAAGLLVVELENAKWLEGSRQAQQVALAYQRVRAKNETQTQTIAELTQTNAKLIELLAASGRRVEAAAEWVAKGPDKREKLAIVCERYNELKSILQPALDRSTEYTEWSAVASPVVAELMKFRWPDEADLPLAVSTLEKALREEEIHHYPETKTDNMRDKRRIEFISHCKFLIDQHREGVEVIK